MKMGEINIAKTTLMPRDNTNVVVSRPNIKKSSEARNDAAVENSNSGAEFLKGALSVLFFPLIVVAAILPVACSSPKEKSNEADKINLEDLDGTAPAEDSTESDVINIEESDGTPLNDSIQSSDSSKGKTSRIEKDEPVLIKPQYGQQDVKQEVAESWKLYIKDMITSDGMPLMAKGVNRTTSEAVSYALLQAAILNDMTTFDKVLGWAKKNMQREDGLFGWEIKDGSFTQYGKDSASDADQDIAAALIIAWKKTGKDTYKQAATKVLNAIWKYDVVTLKNGQMILTAGDKQSLYLADKQGNKVYGVNTSYFRPAYYSNLFKNFDTAHSWDKLTKSSYDYIEKSADATMHGPKSGSSDADATEIKGTKNLPPSFIAVTPDGKITDHTWSQNQDFCFDGDGWRTLYWITLQKKLSPEDNFAKRFFSEKTGTTSDAGPLYFIKTKAQSGEGLISGYQINGEPLYDFDNLKKGNKYAWAERLYSDALAYGYLLEAGEKDAAAIVLKQINEKFPLADGQWAENDPYDPGSFYYGQNWMRFVLLADQFVQCIKK